jgi:hypothetical protein
VSCVAPKMLMGEVNSAHQHLYQNTLYFFTV